MEGSFLARFKQWRAKLRVGEADAVIDELRQLRDANRDHGDEIQRGINYLESNLSRMKYQRYRKDHLPIGSGTREPVGTWSKTGRQRLHSPHGDGYAGCGLRAAEDLLVPEACRPCARHGCLAHS